MKTMEDNLPPVVSGRNNLRPIEDHVDRMIKDLHLAADESARSYLMSILEHVVRDTGAALKLGAERGMDQAEDLILDPDFYARKKTSRKRSLAIAKEKQEVEAQNRERRRSNPTPAEVAESRKYLENDIRYHRQAIERLTGQLQWLNSTPAALMNNGKDVPNA